MIFPLIFPCFFYLRKKQGAGRSLAKYFVFIPAENEVFGFFLCLILGKKKAGDGTVSRVSSDTVIAGQRPAQILSETGLNHQGCAEKNFPEL